MDNLVLYVTDIDAQQMPPAERRAHRTAFLDMLARLGITPRLDVSGVLMAPVDELARGFGVSPDEMIGIAGGPLVVYSRDPADLVALH